MMRTKHGALHEAERRSVGLCRYVMLERSISHCDYAHGGRSVCRDIWRRRLSLYGPARVILVIADPPPCKVSRARLGATRNRF